MKWDQEQIALLIKFYPQKGKVWCMENLNLTEAQVRQKASRLGLRARGISDAWVIGQTKAAQSKVGKKRPNQSEVMKRLHAEGKLTVSFEKRSEASRKGWQRTGKRAIMRWSEHPSGHPKGMKGKVHSAETKLKISEASTKAWASMTDEKIHQRTMKAAKTKVSKGSHVKQRPHTTWKGGWRIIGGVEKYYRSRWEANYARYLQWLLERGDIAKWQHEPKTFWFEGVKRGTVSYLPDFCVTENNGEEVYHEVKGWMDARSATKIKRMKKYHPKVRLIVIGSKEYNSISKTMANIISTWE